MVLFLCQVRRFYSKRVLAVLLLVFVLLTASTISSLRTEEERASPYLGIPLSFSLGIRNREMNVRLTDKSLGDLKTLHQLELLFSDNAVVSHRRGDYREAYRWEILNQIVDVKISKLPTSHHLFDNRLRAVWEALESEIPYPVVAEERYRMDGGKHGTIVLPLDLSEGYVLYSCLQIDYWHRLYDRNLRYTHRGSADNVSFLFRVLTSWFYPFLVFFVVLTTIDSISEEHRSGVTKGLLTLPFSRLRYFFIVFAANLFCCILTLTLLTAFSGFFAGILLGFQSLHYPVLADVGRWSELCHPDHGLFPKFAEISRYSGPRVVDIGLTRAIDYDLYGTVVELSSFSGMLWDMWVVYAASAFFWSSISVSVSAHVAGLTQGLGYAAVIGFLFGVLYYAAPRAVGPYHLVHLEHIYSSTSCVTLLGYGEMMLLFGGLSLAIGAIRFRRRDLVCS